MHETHPCLLLLPISREDSSKPFLWDASAAPASPASVPATSAAQEDSRSVVLRGGGGEAVVRSVAATPAAL